MTTNKPASKKLSLDELVFGALSQLQALGYYDRSIRRYQSVWRRLITFAKKQGFKNKLTEKLILEFLEHYEIKSKLRAYAYNDWRKHAEFSSKILWNYERFGYLDRCQMIIKKFNIPPKMRGSLNDYKKYCEEKRHYSSFTVDECIRELGFFFDFLGKRNIQTFNQIQPVDVSDFRAMIKSCV